jgi:histidinol-phosphate aminotransferase
MGLDAVPSDANFVMVPLESADEAKWLTEGLLHKGVIVRPLGAFGLPHCVRISTGTDVENLMLIGALKELYVKETTCR